MRVYTFHERPGASALVDEPILVREGFNWAAALFTVFWALWQGLWLVAVGILMAAAALETILVYFGADSVLQTAATVGMAAIIGFCANDWRRSKLRRRGYRLEGVVAGDTIDAARRRWFDLHPSGRAMPAAGI